MAYDHIAPLRDSPAAAAILVTSLLTTLFIYLYTRQSNAPVILLFLHTSLHATLSVLFAGRGAQRRWTLAHFFAMATFVYGHHLGMSRLDDKLRSTLFIDQRDTMARLRDEMDNLSEILGSAFPKFADMTATVTAAPEM